MQKVPFHSEDGFSIINKWRMVFRERIGLAIRISFITIQNYRGSRIGKNKESDYPEDKRT
jgi:hypothetical protein